MLRACCSGPPRATITAPPPSPAAMLPTCLCCLARALSIAVIRKPCGLLPTVQIQLVQLGTAFRVRTPCRHNVKNNEYLTSIERNISRPVTYLGTRCRRMGQRCHGSGSNDALYSSLTTPVSYSGSYMSLGWLVYPTLVPSAGVPALWVRWLSLTSLFSRSLLSV